MPTLTEASAVNSTARAAETEAHAAARLSWPTRDSSRGQRPVSRRGVTEGDFDRTRPTRNEEREGEGGPNSKSDAFTDSPNYDLWRRAAQAPRESERPRCPTEARRILWEHIAFENRRRHRGGTERSGSSTAWRG